MAVLERAQPINVNQECNGMMMTPRQFDAASFDDESIYELVNGVLIVTPLPLIGEVDPNQQLGYILLKYQEFHPLGGSLDLTLPEQHIHLKNSRRRADRVIWAGLGRLPRRKEKPTIAVEIVSKRNRDRRRDYEVKREEYLALGIKEYWVFDRFARYLTVFTKRGNRAKTIVVGEAETYQTDLLPGFELNIAQLLRRADLWANETEDD